MNKTLNTILVITWVIIMAFGIFSAGVLFTFHFYGREDGLISIGCWREVRDTNRSIAIRVDNRDIEEIIDTARHEICHEIYYREMNYTFTRDESEEFADTCNPEEYLDDDKLYFFTFLV